MPRPWVTVCLLVYGDFPNLARRALGSITEHFPRKDYRLVVGANAASPSTLRYLQEQRRAGRVDRLVTRRENRNKCPMMRLLFRHVDSPWTWWFDDDSYVISGDAYETWKTAALRAPPRVAMLGQLAECGSGTAFTDVDDPVAFVRQAPWYRGLPPPSWRPGGKGEFDLGGRNQGDGRWEFVLGGCWLLRTTVARRLDWPDRRLVKLGDDVLLGEALRQNGWQMMDLGTPGVRLNTEPRRGDVGKTLGTAVAPERCAAGAEAFSKQAGKTASF